MAKSVKYIVFSQYNLKYHDSMDTTGRVNPVLEKCVGT